jgi:ABC-2 type transport system permease protein
MHRLCALTGVLIRNARNPLATGKNRKVKGFLFVLLIALAFLPIMIQIGLFAHRLFGALAAAGQAGILLAFGFSMASMLIFVFGILSVMAVYYFGQDVPVLLALPLRPAEILAAKFMTSLVHEYIAESLFIIPLFVAFGFHTRADAAYLLNALAVFLLLPVIPVVMASLLVMAVMLFTDLSRNRDRFGKIAGTLLMALVLGMNYLLQKNAAGSADPAQVMKMLMEGKSLWMTAVNRLFPACALAVSAMLNTGQARGLVSLVLFLLVSSGAVAVLLLLGDRFYLRGVLGRAEGGAVKTVPGTKPGAVPSLSSGPVFITCLMKDLRILFRDPVFFMNCIVTNFLWPVLLIFFTSAGRNQDFRSISAFLQQGSGSGLLNAAALGLGMVLTSANGIASSAISREGKNLNVAKFIPVGYSKQILAKAGAAAVMGFIGCLLMLAASLFLLRLPASRVPAVLFMMLCGIAFSVFTGLAIDLNFPKLTWDNAYKAVKQNINVPIHMAICAAVAGLSIWAIVHFQWEAGQTFLYLSLVFILIDAGLWRFLTTRGARIFGDIEV